MAYGAKGVGCAVSIRTSMGASRRSVKKRAGSETGARETVRRVSRPCLIVVAFLHSTPTHFVIMPVLGTSERPSIQSLKSRGGTIKASFPRRSN